MKVTLVHNGRHFQLLEGDNVLEKHLTSIQVISKVGEKEVISPFYLYPHSDFDFATLEVDVPAIKRRKVGPKPGERAYIHIGGSINALYVKEEALAPGQFEGPVLRVVPTVDGLPYIAGQAQLLGVKNDFLVKTWSYLWSRAKVNYDQAVDDLKNVYTDEAYMERLQRFEQCRERLMGLKKKIEAYSLEDFLSDKPLDIDEEEK